MIIEAYFNDLHNNWGDAISCLEDYLRLNGDNLRSHYITFSWLVIWSFSSDSADVVEKQVKLWDDGWNLILFLQGPKKGIFIQISPAQISSPSPSSRYNIIMKASKAYSVLITMFWYKIGLFIYLLTLKSQSHFVDITFSNSVSFVFRIFRRTKQTSWREYFTFPRKLPLMIDNKEKGLENQYHK